jgi:hypothetical protein
MNNLEDIVQIALSAYDKSANAPGRCRDDFELELRRLLMQTESQGQLKQVVKRDGVESVTIRAEPTHTYIINPPNLMGTWTTGGTQAHTRQCPPAIKPEILHG